MELLNEWFPIRKFINFDTPFRTDSTYEKEFRDALPLTENPLHKAEMEYHGKFRHTIGQIHYVAIMIRIDIFYTAFRLETQYEAPTLPGFQGIKLCIQYLASHPHKPIFYPYNYHYGSNVIRLTWSGNQVED